MPNLLELLLSRVAGLSAENNVPNPAFGIMQTQRPGQLYEWVQRDADRTGLPGVTPAIDPRLVSPGNNPYESLESLKRGDIDLAHGQEDLSRMRDYYRRLQQYAQSGRKP
jgi:hypothetical protein